MVDQLLERLPALLERGLDLLVGPVEEAGGPAPLAQLRGDLDQKARLAEPARAMDQPAGGRARPVRCTSQQLAAMPVTSA